MSKRADESSVSEGKDYYLENGLMVFTSAYHIKRGFCCENKCRHCPYGTDRKSKPRKIPE